jgi:hypothetical protein
MAKKKQKIKQFRDWLYEDVAKEFDLKKIHYQSHPFTIEIDTLHFDLNNPLTPHISRLQNILNEYVDTWNEGELKTMFINPFISLVDFVSPNYKVFTQRPMSVKYDNDAKKTEGLVEFMLAKGLQTPQKPHFFLQEYKPEKRRDNDPLGQVLIAMVASQKVNNDDRPVFGTYVVGRLWFFVVLDGKNYAVSKSYSAEDEEIFKIFAILLHIKATMDSIYKE